MTNSNDSKAKGGGASWTPPDDSDAEIVQTKTDAPSESSGYFEFHIRVRYAWLIGGVLLAVVAYPVAVLNTAISMRYFQETIGPDPVYQAKWEATGCPSRIKKTSEDRPLAEFATKNRWKHLLKLDDSYLALNNQDILDDPTCIGARIGLLIHEPGPWRYDIVDTKRQTIIVSVTKGG